MEKHLSIQYNLTAKNSKTTDNKEIIVFGYNGNSFMLCFIMFSCVRVSVFYVAFMDAVFMCACESKITEPLKGHGQTKNNKNSNILSARETIMRKRYFICLFFAHVCSVSPYKTNFSNT